MPVVGTQVHNSPNAGPELDRRWQIPAPYMCSIRCRRPADSLSNAPRISVHFASGEEFRSHEFSYPLAKLALPRCSFVHQCASTCEGQTAHPSELFGSVKQQDHIPYRAVRLGRQPPIGFFSKQWTLIDGIAARDGKRGGAEFQATTKRLGFPRRRSSIVMFFPIAHPREVRTPERVNHQQTQSGIASTDETNF